MKKVYNFLFFRQKIYIISNNINILGVIKMKKQKIIYILAAAIIGIAIGKYIYSSYKEETLQTFKSNDEDIYLLQYGVYKDENVMIENTKKLKNYFYYQSNTFFHDIDAKSILEFDQNIP